MQVTATEAKNRFGSLCALAKKSPVFVHKDGRPDTVILSYVDFQSFSARPLAQSPEEQKHEFQETYKDWIE